MSDLETAFNTLASDALPPAPPAAVTAENRWPRDKDIEEQDRKSHAHDAFASLSTAPSGTSPGSHTKPGPSGQASSSSPSPPAPASDAPMHTLEAPPKPTKPWHLSKARFREEISKDDAVLPLTWQAFLTGLVDSTIFATTSVWVGFITGDFVQLSMNLANFIIPHQPHEGLKMLLRGMAILGFFIGSATAGRVGKVFGWHHRGWLCLSSLMQCVLLWIATGTQLSRPWNEQPNWHWWPPTILMASMSMGMQSTTAQQLANSAFATSVAFTATVSQIASDPHLFKLWPPMAREMRTRDLRWLSLMALCAGAGVGQSLLDTGLGFAGSLAICAACKFVLAIVWWLPPGRPAAPRTA